MPVPSGAATATGLVAIALWSSLALLTAASGTVPPLLLTALTFGIGSIVGILYAASRGRLSALACGWKAWAIGVGGLFGYHTLYFAALRLAPPEDASLLNYLWPLLIVLLSSLLPGERLLPRHVLGALLGFAGAALIIAGRAGDRGLFAQGDWLGYAFALACAFIWSGYSVASRHMKHVPTEAVAGFCLATAILSGLLHLAMETTALPQTGGQWLAIAALGLGPVGLAFYVWDYGVKRGDIKLLGVASYAAPVLSTLLLVIGGYAQATPLLAAACAFIVAGAIVSTWKTRQPDPSLSPP